MHGLLQHTQFVVDSVSLYRLNLNPPTRLVAPVQDVKVSIVTSFTNVSPSVHLFIQLEQIFTPEHITYIYNYVLE